MAQTKIEQLVTKDGQEYYEASCPHDSTIKPRAIKKVIKQPFIVEKKEKDLIAPVAQDIRKIENTVE